MSRGFLQKSQVFTDGAASSSSREPSFDIKRLLLARYPLMIAVATVCAIPALWAACYLAPLDYEAHALLRFQAVFPSGGNNQTNPLPKAPNPTAETGYSPDDSPRTTSYEKYVHTQIALMQNDTILAKALDDPQVKNLAFLADVDDPLAYLKSQLAVRREGLSELFHVSFRSPDPLAAQTIVGRVVASYQDYADSTAAPSRARMESLRATREALEQERAQGLTEKAELARRLKEALSENLQAAASGIDMERGAKIQSEDKREAALALALRTEDAIAQLKKLEGQFGENPQTAIKDSKLMEDMRKDSRVTSLRTQYMQSEAELQLLSAELAPTSRRLQTAQKNFNALKTPLAEMEGNVLGELLQAKILEEEGLLKSYRQDVETYTSRVESRSQRIVDLQAASQGRAAKAAAAKAEMDELETGLAETDRRLDDARRSMDELTMKDSAPARLQLVSGPMVPKDSDAGKRTKYVALAVTLSLLLGASAGILREITDQHLYSPKDVVALSSAPVLAAIPHSKEDRLVEFAPSHRTAFDAPHSPTANEYRRILSRITYPPDSAGETNSLLIASPSSGDGRSSVACNLALLLAEADRRVLLLDTCGHKPMVEAYFGFPQAAGLAEILCESADPMTLVRPVDSFGLDILGPGLRRKDLSNKLVSHEMTNTLEILEHAYDHVIVDSAPGLLVSDAKLIAPLVDGVLVVVGAGVSVRGMVRRFLREMDQVDAEVVGVVVNKIRTTRGGYLKKSLDLYYDYGAQGQDDEAGVVDIQVLDAEASDHDEDVPMILLATYESDAPATEDKPINAEKLR
jgi:capsular exopolysaccharide synthesis family protein